MYKRQGSTTSSRHNKIKARYNWNLKGFTCTVYWRSEPPGSGTNLEKTHKKAHPTEEKKHPVPKLVPFLLVAHMMIVMLVNIIPFQNRPFSRSQGGSGRVDLKLNFMVVVLAFERVGSASHWADVTWAVDSTAIHGRGAVAAILRHGTLLPFTERGFVAATD